MLMFFKENFEKHKCAPKNLDMQRKQIFIFV